MRNMKQSSGVWRGLAKFLPLAIAAGFLLLLPGCQNPLANDSARAAGGTGTLSLSIGGTGAERTILPEGPGLFDRFELVFTREGDTPLPTEVWTDLNGTIDLQVGRWTLVVTALNAANAQVARGSLGFEIFTNGTTSGRVVLAPIGDGNGTFEWDIDLSAVTDLVSATMAVTGLREAGGEVTVRMWDRGGDGWSGNAALRVNVNGEDVLSNLRVWTADGAGPVDRTFNVNSGDVVRFYWVDGNQWDAENAFAVFFSDTPLVPGVFSPSNATPVNDPDNILLLYRQYLAGTGTGSIGSGAYMGSFVVGTVESVNLIARNYGDIELPAGVYRVVFRLENAEGDVATFSEILHVYTGMTSRRAEAFTDVHFLVSVLDIILRSWDGTESEWDFGAITPVHFTVAGVEGVYDVEALEDQLNNTPALLAAADRAVDLHSLRQLVDAALVGIASEDDDILDMNFANRAEAEAFVRSIVRNGTAVSFNWYGNELAVGVNVGGQNVWIGFVFTSSVPVGTLLREDIWERGMIPTWNAQVSFWFPVEAGQEYTIWWNDQISGNGTMSAAIQVSAYFDTIQLFSPGTNGWNSPRTFTAPSSGTVQVTVQDASWGWFGTFSIVYSTGDTRPSFLPTDAIPLTEDTVTAGAIHGLGGEVWYSIEVEAGEQFFLWLNDGFYGDGTLNVNISAWFVNEQRTSYSQSIGNSSNQWYRHPQSFLFWEAGTVYIRVAPSSLGQTGTFAIAYTTVNRSPWFHPPANITGLTEGVWLEGAITTQPWGEAWFSLDVEEGEVYRIWYNSGSAGDNSFTLNGYIHAFYSDGTLISRMSSSWWQWSHLYFEANSTGTVYVMVTGQSSTAMGTFAVTYSTDPDRPLIGFIPDDATPLVSGVVMDGFIGPEGVAWFSIESEIGHQHQLWWNDAHEGDGTQSASVLVSMFDANETLVFFGNASAGFLLPMSFNPGVGNRYYIRVTPMNTGGTGSFQIIYTTAGGPPSPWFAPSGVTALTEDQWRAGHIAAPDGRAWFSFDVVAGESYFVYFNDAQMGQGYNLWGLMGVISSDGAVLLSRTTGGWIPSFTATSTGTVYVLVTAQSTWGEGTFAIAYNTSSSWPPVATETMFNMQSLTVPEAEAHFAGRDSRGVVTISSDGVNLVASASDWNASSGNGIQDPSGWNWSPLTVLPANLAGVQPGDTLSVTITFEGLPGGTGGSVGLRRIGTDSPFVLQGLMPEHTFTFTLTTQDFVDGIELSYNLWSFGVADTGDLDAVVAALANFVVSITDLTVTGYER